jgi:hypothetical protein
MNYAFKAMAHENKIRRWTTFTPPQSPAHAAHCGLVLHWRAHQYGNRHELDDGLHRSTRAGSLSTVFLKDGTASHKQLPEQSHFGVIK